MPTLNNEYCSVFCTRLEFGLALEDIFPPNDLHPRLKYLFSEAYRRVTEYPITIEQILEKYCGSLEDRFEIKENFIDELDYFSSNYIPPGFFLWILRHFLGLLPLPLLPKYTAGEFFEWKEISQICKQYFLHKRYEYDKKEIDYIIARSLCKLPQPNFLLLHTLLNLIRKLCIKPYCGFKINRRSVICLGKYFCPAVFSRPFRPGLTTQNDKLYHPLMFYISMKWLDIIKVVKKIADDHYLISYIPQNEFEIFNDERPFVLTEKLHRYTQTENEQPEYLIGTKNCENNNNYLKDVSCQTETSLLGLINEDGTKVSKQSASCCCAYGSHYDTKYKDKFNSIVNEECDKYMFDDYDTFEKENFNQIGLEQKCEAQRADEEISDLQTLLSITSITNTPPIIVENQSNKSLLSPEASKVLLQKISKIGWSYTPSTSPEVTQRFATTSSPKQLQLQTCIEKIPSCNKSETDVIGHDNEIYYTPISQATKGVLSSLNDLPDTCKSDTAIETEDNSKSIFKNIRSKLGFIRNLSKIATTNKEVSSKIKYKKMSPKSV